MKYIIIMGLVLSCATQKQTKKLTQKELDKKHIKELKEIRPLLVSDDFPYMQCEKLGQAEVKKKSQPDLDFWKRFGLLELREKGLELEANIMSLKHLELKGEHSFTAEFYSCKRVRTVKLVGAVGMCKPSEERLFKIGYSLDDSRAVGEEIIRQVIRHHGISKYYKTYSVDDIKYSFTQKEIQAKSKFFECY